MESSEADENSRLKLAQLWHLIWGTYIQKYNTYVHDRVVSEILEHDFNVNHKVTINPYWLRSANNLANCTALHFLCQGGCSDITTFAKLLERGADFTIKNGNGQTALHLMMVSGFFREGDNKEQMINSLLAAHVKFRNTINPRNDSGVSHLHGACYVNHLEAAKLFLDDEASIDEAVNLNAPNFAGYTPLHFAAKSCSFEVAQTLVSRGANVNAQTTEGYSPIDLILESSFKKADIPRKEKFVELLLENGGNSAVGLSALQVACTLTDLTIAQRLLEQGVDLDYAVPMTSSLHPGNTALHFAARNSIEAVKIC